jgi:STAM-binding protein
LLEVRAACGALLARAADASRAALRAANTERGVETCGILCGKLRGGEFELSHLIIPVQEGSPNTTVTRGEELLIDAQEKHVSGFCATDEPRDELKWGCARAPQGLMTLGWIHTHPTQDCFLSSVDLHTQFSYQTMMPEAVAIVMAPRARVQQGVFTITPRGEGGRERERAREKVLTASGRAQGWRFSITATVSGALPPHSASERAHRLCAQGKASTATTASRISLALRSTSSSPTSAR